MEHFCENDYINAFDAEQALQKFKDCHTGPNRQQNLVKIINAFEEWPCKPNEVNPGMKIHAKCIVVEGDFMLPFYEHDVPWGYDKELYDGFKEICIKHNLSIPILSSSFIRRKQMLPIKDII